MQPIEASRLAAAAGSELFGDGGAVVRGIRVDSRAVTEGDLFVALRGEHRDGHEFIPDAFAAGAAAVLSARRLPVPDGKALLLAEDPLAALGRLGNWFLRRSGARVVGVTGSVGKTSTREWIACVLSARYRVLPGRGNYNTAIGVPLILSGLENEDWAVLEFGMRGPGEIAELGRIAPPDVAVLTRIAESHLGRLGSMEAIAAAKGELLEAAAPGGIAVVNAGDPWQRRLEARIRTERPDLEWLRYGEGEGSSVRAVERRLEAGGTRIRVRVPDFPELDGAELNLPVTGRHQAENALAAVAVGARLGVPARDLVSALAAFRLPSMRGGWRKLGPIWLIDDSYNASPTSTESALIELDERAPGRKLAVLGSMLELGAASPALHARVGGRVEACGVEVLIAVGEEGAALLDGLRPGSRVEPLTAADAEEAWQLLKDRIRPGDSVLVKGSRGVGLDALVRRMESEWQGSEGEARR